MSVAERRDDYLRERRRGFVFLFVPWCDACKRHSAAWKSNAGALAQLSCDVNFLNCFVDPEALERFYVPEYPCVYARGDAGGWRRVEAHVLEDLAAGRRDFSKTARDLLGMPRGAPRKT